MANGKSGNPNGNGGPGVVIITDSDEHSSASGNGGAGDGAGNDAGSVSPESLSGSQQPESGATNAPYGFRQDGSPARKRGRKPGNSGSGSANSGASKSGSGKKGDNAVSGLEKILYSVHMMGANFLKVPELMIAPDEAKILAQSINAVQEYYDWDASEETIIWVNLVGALITVYGPRAAVLVSKANKKKKETPPPTNPAGDGGNVYSIKGQTDATS